MSDITGNKEGADGFMQSYTHQGYLHAERATCEICELQAENHDVTEVLTMIEKGQA